MPTPMTAIYALPTWLFFLLVVIGMVALSGGGCFILRRCIPVTEELAHNDVAGPIVGTIGTILAVVLSFLLIGNWEEYDAAGATVAQEASSVADLFRYAPYFPQPLHGKLQRSILNYVDALVRDEWPAMRNGRASMRAFTALLSIQRTIGTYQPQTAAQENLQQTALGLVTNIMDDRRTRLFDNQQGIPILFWAGNLFLAVITIGFCYLFRVRNKWLHFAMTAALGAVIGTLFVMTAEFDYPFRGDQQIPPFPFIQLQEGIVTAPLLNQTDRPR